MLVTPNLTAGRRGLSNRGQSSLRRYHWRVNTASIILCTLNARYSHASLALRCLMANLGPLQSQAKIVELVIGIKTEVALEKLLMLSPKIIGFSVYIWNVEETTKLVQLLKVIAPHIKVILGGPEVSFETEQQKICALADHIVLGPAERSFQQLCRQLLHGPAPLMKICPGDTTTAQHLEEIAAPYHLYTDQDLAQRLTYFEASRGCPFKCEFCLSSIDKTAWPFDLAQTLDQLDQLYRRGARTFKFIDRTFNLNVASGVAILNFFLERQRADDPVFAHFEVIPDHLPEPLRALIVKFPPGALQFEIGIQTLNPEVQKRISRRQDSVKAQDNVRWLVDNSEVHLHLDLIGGLPGEDLLSFATGFNQLVDWLGLLNGRPHEIQLGILKRLRGTPIIRHTEAFALRFNPNPPYNVLATSTITFNDMRRLERFARYWDLIANREATGQQLLEKSELLVQLLGDHGQEEGFASEGKLQNAFACFMAFSDWLYERTDSTFKFERQRLHGLAREWLGMTRARRALLEQA
jgi:radical SAM superfamily enzyme YgiQ (UPF0313 family)